MFDWCLIEFKDVISVIGFGYVGVVLMVCFSLLGYVVVGVDIDLRKVEFIFWGQSLIVED